MQRQEKFASARLMVVVPKAPAFVKTLAWVPARDTIPRTARARGRDDER